MAKMRAIVCTGYGPPEVLQLREVDIPVPSENEVLIRVHAATVMAGDCELRSLKVSFLWKILLRLGFGITAPRRKILGQDLSGEVVGVGSSVTKFKVGDQVFGNTGLRLGAYAEYACLPATGVLETKPENLSYNEASTLPAAGTYVLPLLRKADIRPGQRVLVVGAGGTMGTVALQFAKSLGAVVTGVDSARKLEMLRSTGADDVVDFTLTDPTTTGQSYDVIVDLVGKGSVSGYVRALKENGVLLLGNPGIRQLLEGRFAAKGSRKVKSNMGSYPAGALVELRALVETGKIRAIIDRVYPLEQTPDAHRYVDTGQKSGNVVITP